MKWIQHSFVYLVIFSNSIFSKDLERPMYHRGLESRPSRWVDRGSKKDFYNEIPEEYLLESSSEWNPSENCQGIVVCKVHVEGTEVQVLGIVGQDDTHVGNKPENYDKDGSMKVLAMEDHHSGETQGNSIDFFMGNCEECEECQECGECEGCEGCDDDEFYT
ncbi:hypothetical protein MERGE_000343 [Pneumocystis wakefieldiae]|uniref:Uncharacterized protein n=1 Tax=Pneumocystis wakefieldiae TaxID=38082 RepID=A0A899FYH4_9ASCO|nr:hypothetical protein MERGE_000343 [Pneumocystis wakefieldiae]